MSKHMTIINLACTITKLRKWGEAWKHSAESAQAATARMHQAHEAKMVEHRAAFGARTEADAKIIAGLRSEIGAARMAVLERDSLMSERDGLLTQVQDMRAEMERLRDDERKAWAEVAALQERLRSSIARGDFAQMEVAALKSQSKTPKYKVGDKLESRNRSLGQAITIVGVRTVYDCQADGAAYSVGHSEAELKKRYEQTPKHPVKVGEWVECVCAPGVGTKRQVLEVHADWYLVDVGHSWTFDFCIPCDHLQRRTTPRKARRRRRAQ